MSQSAADNTTSQSPGSPLILSLDIGTSSTRALLFDAAGHAIQGVQSQLPYRLTTTREGEASVDADALVKLTAQAIDGVLSAAGPMAQRIAAVATSCFWHSLVAVDASGHALTPVLSWEDNRARQAVVELSHEFDDQAIHRRTGARLHTSYWPAKILWLAETMPDVFKQTAQWLSIGEYLHRHFLGRSVCSLSMASGTGMTLIRERTWDSELQRAVGARPEQFPPLGDLRDSVQGLTAEYAQRWPALRNVPWFPATGDGAAANIGSGCVTGENWALTIGTSSAMRIIVPPDAVVPSGGLWLYRVDARRGLLGGALSEGGNIPAWLEATVQLPPLVQAEPLIATLPPNGHGLTVLPFISGERSPGWHDRATMAITGLTAHTTPADILRASLEAIAYQINAVYQELLAATHLQAETNAPQSQQSPQSHQPQPRLIGSGGALLSSPTFQGIIASTLNTSLYPSLEREASARGVALLALEALGNIPDVAQVPAQLGTQVMPDAEQHAAYIQGMERQGELYRLLLENSER